MLGIVFLFVYIVITTIYLLNIGWNPIVNDGAFYYTHLPSFFIYHDLDLNFLPNYIEAEHIKLYYVYGYIKYPIGCAYLQTPFFLIAHFFALMINENMANGYSFIYKLFMEISSIFFWLIGVILNYKILKNFIKDKNIQLTIIAITLGSGLYYYTCFESTMSHVYSYFAVTLFIYIVIKIESHTFKNKKDYFLLGLSLGLAVAIRNINIIMIIFYLLYKIHNVKDLKIKIIDFLKIKNLFCFLFGFIILMFPQMLYWYNRTGHWIINSYHPEYYIKRYENILNPCDEDYFHFNNPKIFLSLFSLHKGLFVYYPALLYSILGLKSYRKFFPNLKFALPVLLLIIIYVYSSWECWDSGAAFGLRYYVDYLCLFSILIASFLEDISLKSTKLYNISIFVLFLLIIITLIFCYLVNNVGNLDNYFKECFDSFHFINK